METNPPMAHTMRDTPTEPEPFSTPFGDTKIPEPENIRKLIIWQYLQKLVITSANDVPFLFIRYEE